MFKLIFFCVFVFGAVNPSDISFYEILSVSKQASTQQIRQAYKKLAVKFHPDKNPNGSEQEKFLKITEAYETLKDPEKRRHYDIYGTYQTYSRKYNYKSQTEYDNLYYKGLYHEDPYVDTLSGASFYNYLKDGIYFINFYSPFCPPCQNVAEDWKKLAKIYKGIVKVGAVNCKYHNSFCYNSMRIGSYPSLLFYPNGRHGNYIYYRGERSFEALDDFLYVYLSNLVPVPIVSQLRSTDRPMVYILKEKDIDKNALTRIAFRLAGLATVVIVDDDDLREKLTKDEYTTIMFKYKTTSVEIESSNEDQILREIIEALPSVELIDPEKLKEIRNDLRNGAKTPWVFYFSSKGETDLKLHQMRTLFPNMHFGNIDCEKWNQLCSSLHVDETPAWGVMKERGGYQRAYTEDVKEFINIATKAVSLHTLSTSDYKKILAGDVGVWVLLVVPYDSTWDEFVQPFTEASLHFNNNEEINFGIMVCTANTDAHCRQVAPNQVTIIVQNGTKRYTYSGRTTSRQLLEYIYMLRENGDLELDEQKVLEVLDSRRPHTWLVAYMPAQCGHVCEQLTYEIMLVANKLRPLKLVRVGILQCERTRSAFCNNVRLPTAKLYPLFSGHHYSVNLQNLAQAPYILEWALPFIDDSVQKINWHTFTRTVIAEELNPTSGKKPWLIYFHSPRCYRCYEMYADFAIAGILLNNAIQLGKVNCINERGLCQHEQITSFPSLKLYLNRNQNQRFSSVVTIQVRDYHNLLEEIKPHLMRYDRNLFAGADNVRKTFIHDEF